MSFSQPFMIKLPRNYRSADFLNFHRRDPQMMAERVDDNRLTKGIMWEGKPALLIIEFFKTHANVQLDVSPDFILNQTEFQICIERMLGLHQAVTTFEKKFIDHPHLGSLIKKNPGLRVAVTATPFEAISWAITGQQISVNAAISIRRKFIQLANMQHVSGLWCYPDEQRVSQLDENKLRLVGFSQSKAKTLMALSTFFINEKINLTRLSMDNAAVEKLADQLLQIPGIGPWTISYALLRGFGWLDGSLHGDVAVRRGLQMLIGVEKISEKEAQQWLAEFSPWRALVAAHLWQLETF